MNANAWSTIFVSTELQPHDGLGEFVYLIFETYSCVPWHGINRL